MSDVVGLATRAYMYGFPMVFNLEQVQRFVTSGIGAMNPAPFNVLSHGRKLASAEDTFVSINNDTVYSMAQLDLDGGPVRLQVPDSNGRYYVLQFVDAWTNNFAYVGHRATGTTAQDLLLVPPGWTGEAADGQTVIHVPTRIASVVGRWACTGEDDFPAVTALQDAMVITPASNQKPPGLPTPDPNVPDDLMLLEKLRVWSQAFPPAPRDHEFQDALAPLGTSQSGSSPYLNADEAWLDDLRTGLADGAALLEHTLASGGSSPVVNGWQLTMHVFDYNLDFFEVGALDDPEFKINDPQLRLVTRAAAAKGGLWGNHAYEAVYIMTYVDDHGDRLHGSNAYTLRLDPPPPVGAFWSLTMYDDTDFYLVDNPIDRYSLGDRTPGIVYDADGSLTIHISHTPPDDAAGRANWLPAPAEGFRPILRMYEPARAVLDQEYVVPAIARA